VAATYTEALRATPGLTLPTVAADREHVWHLYVVQHEQRDDLARHLATHGVQTVVNYPVALPFLPAYQRFEHRPEDFPVAFGHQSRVLSLPMFAEITAEQVERVRQAVRGLQ
jgi:dTDP-4-amino-4,6-dideoxygalactose transaminase